MIRINCIYYLIVSLSAIFFLLLPSALCIGCFACLPDLAGGTFSQEVALKWRANISRTWENRRESSFGLCSKMDGSEKFQVVCPDNSMDGACLTITRGPPGYANKPDWRAETCGTLTKAGEGCIMSEDGIKACFCLGDFCNESSNLEGHRLFVAFLAAFSLFLAGRYAELM